jgi:hypothetical protein
VIDDSLCVYLIFLNSHGFVITLVIFELMLRFCRSSLLANRYTRYLQTVRPPFNRYTGKILVHCNKEFAVQYEKYYINRDNSLEADLRL